MYLTGGQYKGYKIKVPKSAKPTLSKVRESVFNMLLQYDLRENTFLDMFSGSGIMGLEAISRGYNVTQIEINKEAYKLIKENCSKIQNKPELYNCNALNFKTEKKYEIIYIDPPWLSEYNQILIKANKLLSQNGIIIVEHDLHNKLNLEEIIKKTSLNLELIKSKKYGRCLIDILKQNKC